MPFSFKPTTSQTEGGSSGSSFSFGSTDDLMARAKESGTSILQFVVYGVFGAACLATVGLFGYRYYLNSQIESTKATIAAQEGQLANYPIDDMRSISVRLKAINQLVQTHPYVDSALRILEDSIEDPIVYQSFSFKALQSGTYEVNVQATSPDYKTIAQQVDTLKSPPYSMYIPDVKVSGLTPDSKGNIAFSLSMPMSVTGVMPEDLNLSYGAAAQTTSSSSTEQTQSASTGSASSTLPSNGSASFASSTNQSH